MQSFKIEKRLTLCYVGLCMNDDGDVGLITMTNDNVYKVTCSTILNMLEMLNDGLLNLLI